MHMPLTSSYKIIRGASECLCDCVVACNTSVYGNLAVGPLEITGSESDHLFKRIANVLLLDKVGCFGSSILLKVNRGASDGSKKIECVDVGQKLLVLSKCHDKVKASIDVALMERAAGSRRCCWSHFRSECPLARARR